MLVSYPNAKRKRKRTRNLNNSQTVLSTPGYKIINCANKIVNFSINWHISDMLPFYYFISLLKCCKHWSYFQDYNLAHKIALKWLSVLLGHWMNVLRC